MCYAGNMSPDDRRALILRTLRAKGAMFPSQLRDELNLTSSVYNDLLALSKSGRIENTDHGWRVKASATAEETAGQVAPVVPFDHPQSGPTSLPSRSN